MFEMPRQWWAFIARLLPKQKVQGDGAIQLGKVGGNVTIVHVTQTADIPPKPEAAPVATEDQREVLRLIRRLRNPESVFKFMERSFQTRMVIDLRPRELLRLRRYVESIHRTMGIDVDRKK